MQKEEEIERKTKRVRRDNRKARKGGERSRVRRE
jgi:hypothetical protein